MVNWSEETGKGHSIVELFSELLFSELPETCYKKIFSGKVFSENGGKCHLTQKIEKVKSAG